MLASMLGSHTAMLAVPESQFKVNFLHGVEGEFSIDSVSQALSMVRSDLTFKSWGLDSVISQASAKDFDGSYHQFVEYFVAQYAAQNVESKFDYWVDHTPSNIDHAHFLLTQFPDSKMLHIVRDGRAIAASVLPLDWGPFTVKRAADVWRLHLASGLAAQLSSFGDRVLMVRYEGIVREPSRVLKEISDFIGVRYEEGMELGKGFAVPGASKQQHSLVSSIPNPERIDAWRTLLSVRQIEIFEYYAGDMLEMMGYDTPHKTAAIPPSSYETLRMNVADLIKPYFNMLLHLRRQGETPGSTLSRRFNAGNLRRVKKRKSDERR